MSQRVRSAVAAVYLLLCILLGGSAQGVWSNLALQLIGIALIFLTIFVGTRKDDSETLSVLPLVLLSCGLVLVLLQLIPVPPAIWAALPGRSELVSAYALMGQRAPALPVSEAPFDSVMALIAFIPAIAMFVAVSRLRPSPRMLAVAIIAGTVCSLALGALQVAGGRDSWAYLYPITNGGAVGVFANRNHMGTLLLASIPFGTALLASTGGERGSRQGRIAIGSAVLVLIVVGIALNASLAVLALALPILVASASILPAAAKWRGIALPLAVLALFGGVALLASNPIATATDLGAESSVKSRVEIWATTSQAVRDSFPVGTGLGTFEKVHRQYEDPVAVTSEYVNHAHNDYVELALELGAPGMLLIILFLGWWAATAVHIWTSPLSTPFGRAATIASAAMLAHSIVDFPLRTAAIAAIFASTVALMSQRLRMHSEREVRAPGGTRHVKLG